MTHTMTSQRIALTGPALLAAALCLLPGAARAQAQAFDPVRPMAPAAAPGARSAEASAAARRGNPYGDAQGDPVRSASRRGERDRASVRAEAVDTAHDRGQNLDRRAFVNSEIPPQVRALPGTPRTAR